MSTEQQRAEFEALLYKHPYLRELGTLKNPNGDYCDLDIQDCWEFYQAGRAALQSQHRGGYAGVTVWVGQIGCTKIIPKIQYKTSNADELLRHFEAARLAIDHARRVEGGGE